jgi:hypothetical protein
VVLEAFALTEEERDDYENLLLLCKVHHKQIDDQPTSYPVDRLNDMKRAHESRVREALSPSDVSLQSHKEVYAAYVDEWSKRASPNLDRLDIVPAVG